MNIQIRKFFYGDIPEEKGGSTISSSTAKNDWPLWEIFIRSKQGLDHKHAGSLHAADAQMAIENAQGCIYKKNGRREHLGGGKQIYSCQQSR